MRTTNHAINPEEVMAYLDGELPVNRAATVAAHLDRCEECQAVAADLRLVGQRLMDWQVDASEAAMKSASTLLDDARRGESRPAPSVRRVPLWVWSVAAASLAVVLFVAVRSNQGPAMDGLERNASSSVYGSLADDKSFARPAPFAGLRADPPLQAPAPTAAPGESQTRAPMIARTAHLTLSTGQFDRTRAALDDILKRRHGYFGDLTVTAPENAGRTLQATLRVPDAELDASIIDLKQLGRTENESRNGEEVTAQYADLEARLANARNTEQRLTELLQQRTGKLSDVLQVEIEIARVRGEIERMEAERKGLANRVSFATLTVTMTEGYRLSVAGRLRNAAAEGFRMMADSCVGAAAALISYGPTLLLWGLLLLIPGRLLWIRLRRG